MTDTRLVRASGTAGERGESIGAATGERIRALLAAQDQEHRDRDGLTLHGWLPAARRFEPLIREHAPVTAAEMAGMAAGAGLPADELLLLACAYEKYMGTAPAPAPAPVAVADGHCTALGAAGDATAAGDVICGQNNDELIAGWLGGAADVAVHHTADDGLQTLIYTHAGVPAYMGMNSAGLCVTWMYIDDGERGPGLPTCVLIRELLTMRSVPEAVSFLDRTPHAVPNAFLLGHPEGLSTVEVFPRSRMRVREASDVLWHANHILDAELAAAGKTLASMVFEPAAGTMHLAFGNGCEEPYTAYRFDP